jgi:hypothetical protein
VDVEIIIMASKRSGNEKTSVNVFKVCKMTGKKKSVTDSVSEFSLRIVWLIIKRFKSVKSLIILKI